MTDALNLRPPDLIARKRDGGELAPEELAFLVAGYLAGSVSEGQMAAFLMAGVLRGFTQGEARALTQVLLDSGETMDLSSLTGPTVDKHSTGGVSDGTTLIVAPLLAAAGLQLVKLSGRGLGHTGGTLDKLESIPGMRVDLDPERMLAIAEAVGWVVAAQTAQLVPADKALYALRDVTATVPSPALIASSVMSKKLAAGAQTVVLDVKAGDGAFMASQVEAVQLAQLCVDIGAAAGRQTVALVTAMDQPLGRAVGNALEIAEVVTLLQRAPRGRLADVAVALAATALGAARGTSADEAVQELRARWESGEALDRLRMMIAAQGGDVTVCDDPAAALPTAPVRLEVTAARTAVVRRVPARAVGELAAALGAGRAHAGDSIDPAVGLVISVEVGQRVEAGDTIAVVHARNPDAGEQVAARLRDLIEWSDEPVDAGPVILDRIRPTAT